LDNWDGSDIGELDRLNQAAQLRLEQVSLTSAIAAQVLLHDISADIFQGDRLAIVGPTGAGKTSLLRLLNRLTELSSGQIYLNGQEIRQIPPIKLRQQIILVHQESSLLGMTVQQALSYPLQLRGLSQHLIQQRLVSGIEQLRIPQEWLEKTEAQLSVGQRQWVAIARAILAQPAVLLLDEPTSALDAGRAEALIELLIPLATAQHTTIVMVNHQLELAQQFCDRLLYLERGTLIQNLPAQQVNWQKLREMMVQANQQADDDWD
jgi:D-methionine transport system ATP-binding protein